MLNVSDILKASLEFDRGESPRLFNARDIRTMPPADSEKPADAIRYGAGFAPVVVWNVTNVCNMACPHCYSAAKHKPGPGELTHSQATRLIDNLARGGVRILIFSGGEPLLRPDTLDLIRYAGDKNILCHLSTNGVYLTTNTVLELKDAGVGYVGVSLDGMPDFNDDYRKLKDAYNLALSGVLRARDAGMITGVRMTLSQTNRSHLDPLLDMAKSEDLSRFYISHLVYSGRGKGYARHDLTPERSAELMNDLFEKAFELARRDERLKIVTGGNDVDGALLYKFVKAKLGDLPAQQVYKALQRKGGNSAGEKMINIDEKGLVHPDQFWRDLTLGNILESELSDILNCDWALKLRNRSAYLKGKCAECKFIDICRGSHRERALAATGDVWAPDPACYLGEEEVRNDSHKVLIKMEESV